AQARALAHLGRWGEAMEQLDSAMTAPYVLAPAEILQEAADVHGWYGTADAAQGLLEEAARSTEIIGDGWRVSAAQNLIRLRRFDEAGDLLERMTPGSYNAECAH